MKITARAAIGSANYHGDLSYIKDNELQYLDQMRFEKQAIVILWILFVERERIFKSRAKDNILEFNKLGMR